MEPHIVPEDARRQGGIQSQLVAEFFGRGHGAERVDGVGDHGSKIQRLTDAAEVGCIHAGNMGNGAGWQLHHVDQGRKRPGGLT